MGRTAGIISLLCTLLLVSCGDDGMSSPSPMDGTSGGHDAGDGPTAGPGSSGTDEETSTTAGDSLTTASSTTDDSGATSHGDDETSSEETEDEESSNGDETQADESNDAAGATGDGSSTADDDTGSSTETADDSTESAEESEAGDDGGTTGDAGDCSLLDDCPEGMYCDWPNGCQPGCRTDDDCEGGSCDPETMRCVCSRGQHACDLVCVDDDDITSCGDDCETCAKPENGQPACVAARCDVACDAGYQRDDSVWPPVCVAEASDLDIVYPAWGQPVRIFLNRSRDPRVLHATSIASAMPTRIAIASPGDGGWQDELVSENTMGTPSRLSMNFGSEGERYVLQTGRISPPGGREIMSALLASDLDGTWVQKSLGMELGDINLSRGAPALVNARGHVHIVGPRELPSGEVGVRGVHFSSIEGADAAVEFIAPDSRTGSAVHIHGSRAVIIGEGSPSLLSIAPSEDGATEPNIVHLLTYDAPERWRAQEVGRYFTHAEGRTYVQGADVLVNGQKRTIVILDDARFMRHLRVFREVDPNIWRLQDIGPLWHEEYAIFLWCSAAFDDGRVVAVFQLGQDRSDIRERKDLRMLMMAPDGSFEESLLATDAVDFYACSMVTDGQVLHLAYNSFDKGLKYVRWVP